MSLFEPRCLVCGAPMPRGKWCVFEKEVIGREVCSNECYEAYMHDEDAADALNAAEGDGRR